MPELFKHFETLDITTDLFLIDWMLTLYSKILDIGVVSRIWDNFMLDGEIFAIKTGLALLQYRENELTNQSYYRIINILRGPGSLRSSDSPDRKLESDTKPCIDEDRLFQLIEAIEIDSDDYYGDLKMQKWSYQKSKILGGVFK